MTGEASRVKAKLYGVTVCIAASLSPALTNSSHVCAEMGGFWNGLGHCGPSVGGLLASSGGESLRWFSCEPTNGMTILLHWGLEQGWLRQSSRVDQPYC